MILTGKMQQIIKLIVYICALAKSASSVAIEMAQPLSVFYTNLPEDFCSVLSTMSSCSQLPVTPADLTPLTSAGVCIHGHTSTSTYTHTHD